MNKENKQMTADMDLFELENIIKRLRADNSPVSMKELALIIEKNMERSEAELLAIYLKHE